MSHILYDILTLEVQAFDDAVVSVGSKTVGEVFAVNSLHQAKKL